ncbi:heme-binding protein [Saccharothrix sp. NPDC042600]|uniref:GlcG/HbpS family heme-binding protein n=1 Tax=Saccharothrix TaxID=2071 RepID=UPI0033FDE003|nr:heme-binding protein [Saccharothrix mutabilis subsp. capreolus]
MSTLSLRDARRLLDAAVQHAEQLGVQAAIAVVDEGGHTKASARADGATFLTLSLATGKAVTAAGLGFDTSGLGEFLAGDPALLAGLSTQAGVTVVPGGVPIVRDGAVIGAIGVSGGTGGEDEPIARAALSALVTEAAV